VTAFRAGWSTGCRINKRVYTKTNAQKLGQDLRLFGVVRVIREVDVVGEYSAFVDLARDATVGREAYERRVAGFERDFNCGRVAINPRSIPRPI
jgi:hypothetical protein